MGASGHACAFVSSYSNAPVLVLVAYFFLSRPTPFLFGFSRALGLLQFYVFPIDTFYATDTRLRH